MRLSMKLVLGVAGLVIFSQGASAQIAMPGASIGNMAADPFSGYYSWFLPRQAAMAAAPTINNQLNQYTAERVASQNSSAANMPNVLDYASLGIGAATGSAVDDNRPRNPRPRISSTGPIVENAGGRGLGQYHGRANSYFPTLRGGTYTNTGLPRSRGR